MITKTIPVVIYGDNGTRRVVGSAVVEVEGEYISLDARVNLDHVVWNDSNMQFSLGPFSAPKAGKKGK